MNMMNLYQRISVLIRLTAGFLFFICSGKPSFAQTYWMQKAASTSINEGAAIATDANGNTYTTGYFTGFATFGAVNLTAAGVSDVFTVKTNNSGVVQWAEKGGDGGADRGLAIAADANGNSYVTGYYFGTAVFGTYTVTAAGSSDAYVVKYDPNGNVLWLATCGGPVADIANSIAVDKSGNVVITGQFAGTAAFGATNLTASGGNVNVFTAKLNGSTGAFLWAKSGVGLHTDRGIGIACDGSDNVYVTGQFSDTITFDQVHYSSFYDAIFLIKYSSTGTEQWFTMAGGGTYNVANAITTDNASNVLITGNFGGVLTFFGSPNVNLSNAYPNDIFVAKYSSGGALLWAAADGAKNSITSNSISTDASGNACITGNFECLLNGYADRYGQGTFNSVGSWDVFSAGYSQGGAWQWSRQIGGHGNNYANGIAVDQTGDIYLTGSFDQDMIVPCEHNFAGYNVNFDTGCNTSYCSDANYGRFAQFNAAGSLDAFIAKPVDLNRQPYDFYVRSGNNCNRPMVGVCIDTTCPDTVSLCSGNYITATPRICSAVGPYVTFLWSNMQSGTYTPVFSQGWYSVTERSADGCLMSKDSVYVKMLPPPAAPNISDNVVINNQSYSPRPIHICADSVQLTGGGYGGYSYFWSGGSTATTLSVEAKKNGMYCFNVKNSQGCTNSTCVQVTLDSPLVNIGPKLECLTCNRDTVRICQNDNFTMFAYDSISNPSGNVNLCMPPFNYTSNRWGAKPNSISYQHITSCPDLNTFIPSDSGWYQITDTIYRANACDTLTKIVRDSVYVRLYPLPKLGPVSITGVTQICQGDSTLLVAHDTAAFIWSNGSTKDSIWVFAGAYSITSSVTNAYGCKVTVMANVVVSYKQSPVFTVTSGGNLLICPGDSIELTVSGGPGTFQWYGPSGQIGGDTNKIWVKLPGSYYCNISDTAYCHNILSNTLVVTLYATPYVQVGPNNHICQGDSARVSVYASEGSVIQWGAPLSGSDSVLYIKTPGTYTCTVTSCGITTSLPFTISVSYPVAKISSNQPHVFCADTTAILTANSGMAGYLWLPVNVAGPSYTVSASGTYTLIATDSSGCKAQDTMSFDVTPNNIPAPLVPDTSMCPYEWVTLSATGKPTLSWYLSPMGGTPLATGSTYTTPVLDSDAVYYVQSAYGGCVSPMQEVKVNMDDCNGIYIPNVFTPNGDGKDDVWFVSILGAKCFQANIYNRWGQLVFQSNDAHIGWDGIIHQTGRKASDGVYYYIVNYCNYKNEQKSADGFLQLLRNQ